MRTSIAENDLLGLREAVKAIKNFYEEWTADANRQLTTDDLKKSVSDDSVPAIRQLTTGELGESDIAAFFSVGFTQHMEIIFKCQSVAERLFYIRYSMPLGVATYRTSQDVPPAYKALRPLLEGSQKLLQSLTMPTKKPRLKMGRLS